MSQICQIMSQILQCCLPTALILVFLWTYYAYVVELCILKVASVLKKALYLLFYHCCFILVTIFYFTSMCIGNAAVPSNYRLTIMELEAIRRLPPDDRAIDIILERFCYIRGIRTYTRTNNRIRYCMKCKVIKPDRTHHCSNCKVCVLKMDHHCPWLDNCVGFNNYKFFFLLLVYTSLYCLYYAGTSAEYVYLFCMDEEMRQLRQLNYVTGFGVAVILGIGMVSLLCFHIAAVLRNETTLESMSEPVFIENCSFNLGKYYNFAEVFGYNCVYWFLPVRSSLGDGVVFPIRFD